MIEEEYTTMDRLKNTCIYRQVLILVVLLAGILALMPQSSAAQSNQRCFSETGYCISGAIRAYWERNGGLAVFGYPVTHQQIEDVEGTWQGPVQWFERDRLEDHSNQGIGVLAGRLGARYLELQDTPWQAFAQVDVSERPGHCIHFQGRYGEAAALYGGSYKQLSDWNLDIPLNDTFHLWERGCTVNGLVCLSTRRVLQERNVTPYEAHVTVEFRTADGQLFRTNGQSAFTFTLKKIGERWLVMDLPVYVA